MIDKIASDWQLQGFSCDLWVDDPGQRWEDYKHDTDELFMLIEGKIELKIGDKTLKPKINEVVHIPANTKHSVRNIGDKKAKWLYGYKMPDVNKKDIEQFNK